MSTPTDPRVDILLAEVAGIRRQLDSIGRVLGVDAAGSPTPPVSPLAPPAASRGADERASSSTGATVWAAREAAEHRMSGAEGRAARPAPEGSDASGPSASPGAGAGRDVAAPPTVPARTSPFGLALTPARVLAAGGALVTILGVGFLLAVAIAAGLFGPVPRVVTLAVLAGALAVAASRLRARSREAAVALAATSTAAAFGVVVAMTTIYGRLSPLLGVAAGVLITAAGVGAGHRWRSELLAALVHAQVLLVLPMILAPLDDVARVQLVVFTFVAYVPSVWAVLTHRWMRLFRFASGTVLLVALTGLVEGTRHASTPTAELVRIATAIVAVLVVAGLACLLDDVATAALAVGASALATVVLRLKLEQLDVVRADIVVAALLAAVFGAAAWRYRGTMRGVLVVAASVHLFLATLALPVDDQMFVVLLAVEALALLVASRAPGALAVWWSSVAFTAVAVLGLMSLISPLAVLTTAATNSAGRWGAIVVGALLAVVGLLQARWATGLHVPTHSPERRALAGLALAVYATSSAIVTIGLLPGMSPRITMAADVSTTLVWVGVAIAMLRRPSRSISKAGYVVLAVAVGKLFLADLHTVDGILRAVLFVVTGLGLIGAATQIRTSAPEPATPPAELAGARD